VQPISPGIGAPFFSPDGQWIGFYSSTDFALKKISVTGGPPIEISKVRTLLGANWDGDHIIFGDAGKGIARVSDKEASRKS
jgi:eukaryotic-like serine/threonine-protein kinase